MAASEAPECFATLLRASCAMRRRPLLLRDRQLSHGCSLRLSGGSTTSSDTLTPSLLRRSISLRSAAARPPSASRLGRELRDEPRISARALWVNWPRRSNWASTSRRFALEEDRGRLTGKGHAEDGLRDRVVQLTRHPVALLRDGQPLQLSGIVLQFQVGRLKLPAYRLIGRARLRGTARAARA